LDLLDPQAILRACGSDDAILERLCVRFQSLAPAQMARVGSALRAKDAPRLREAAHRLSSTLATFSNVAGTTTANLEDEAARGQIEACIPLVARLESMCSELVEQSRNLSIESLGS
jgi:HPt (histidine-containing phosphotransfer) domain-containing protein